MVAVSAHEERAERSASPDPRRGEMRRCPRLPMVRVTAVLEGGAELFGRTISAAAAGDSRVQP
jgi:hypothetical protein